MANFIVLIAVIAIVYFGIQLYKHRRAKITDKNGLILRKRNRVGLIVSILVMLIASGISGAHDNQTTQSDTAKTSSTKITKKKQYVGKDKYNIAKKENVALVAKEKKLSDQADELQSQKDQITSDEAQAKEQAEQQQKEAQKQQEQQAKEAQKQQEQQAQSQSNQASTQTRGDMNTGSTGKIVGNSNSHIYHVPGQRGYNMNSSNAVYFNNEQDAINAGYRRSKV